MKKSATILILLGLFLASPAVLAQEQALTQERTEIYSGFNRFVDNVKMFFSFKDKKVMLALDIRDKELNSAIVNTKNGDDEEVEKNLERARKKLQFVQNKVSRDMAENVKNNINKAINKIKEEENLSYNLETHLLEEEKTKLTAELVAETKGKDGESGKNEVKITIDGDDGQTRVMEIEGKITEINNQIAERMIDNVIKEGGNDGSLVPEVKTDKTSIEENRNIVVEEITKDDRVKDVVKDNIIENNIVKDDKIQIENKDVSSATNNIDGKIDDEVDSGQGESGVIDKD